jgi:rhodanese-related sulfurtransferase/rubrerythrin
MSPIQHLYPDEVEDLQRSRKEGEYLLVDVRQPEEYAQSHIPGARLLPLPELEDRLAEIPTDRDVVFYCRSGSRSSVAAALLAEGQRGRTGAVGNLVGGILAWEGHDIRHIPHLETFPRDLPMHQILYRAMNLEKGAHLFYMDLAEDPQWTELARELGDVERRHARALYGFWVRHHPALEHEPFDTLFERIDGNVMEGGKPMAAWLARLEAQGVERRLRLLEVACEIEYHAYDLYRTLAHRAPAGSEEEHAYLTLATQEKAHIRMVTKALTTTP